jgi:nucleoside-diphosphate-sugar epimerase
MIKHTNSAPIAPAKVVILGASGFVGSHLVSLLAESKTPTLALSSADLDLENPDSTEKLANIVGEGDSLVFISALTPDRGRDIGTLMKNLTMGQHVSAVLQESKCSQVVYVSSDAVYQDDVNPVRENSNCEPSGFHGIMHIARERMLSHVLQGQQVPLFILRASLLYGPNDTHNGYGPNRFIRTATSEQKISLFGEGEEKRDHVFIGDLCRLIELGLTHGSDGILNVANGQSASFIEAALAVKEALSDEVEIVTSERQSPITHRHFDTSATQRAFPSFQFTPLDVGISETVAHVMGSTAK